MLTKPIYQKAKYLNSAAELKQLPQDEGVEVAFIGRSNAGKSSALNTITGIKGLARTSQTPGRTQMINLFELDSDRRLVDLPGYGYAKAPRVMREKWIKNTNEYLRSRDCLKGLVLVMDIRHPLKDSDQHLIEWTLSCHLPIHVLLTKADKLKSGAKKRTLREVSDFLHAQYGDAVTVQIFSSQDRCGLDEAQEKLDDWFSGLEV
ncbi:MAG: YihA family ribosome biogenesis GTP-binding protein [Coxiella sp. (in: Bacteria)]|nr:MAG: YihA family ribosome biogenesis GTP-binding protein [Coxiella sp. (in: g-proteobacteria)]